MKLPNFPKNLKQFLFGLLRSILRKFYTASIFTFGI